MSLTAFVNIGEATGGRSGRRLPDVTGHHSTTGGSALTLGPLLELKNEVLPANLSKLTELHLALPVFP